MIRAASCLLDRHPVVVDLAQLVARDHDQLDRAITLLIEPTSTLADRRSALDATRVTLAAHADAEAAVLHVALAHVVPKQDIAGLVAHVLAAHRIQESILRRMDANARTDDWTCASIRLRRSLLLHAEQEQTIMMRSLREFVPALEYHRLAATYTAEKLRALGVMAMLAPLSRRSATRLPRRAAR